MKTHEKRREQVLFSREDRSSPVATFKNSLRLWQARWKVQQAAPAAQTASEPQTQDGSQPK